MALILLRKATRAISDQHGDFRDKYIYEPLSSLSATTNF
jgi:hypothetical protein